MSTPIVINGQVKYITTDPTNKWTAPYSNAHQEFIKYAGKLQALALANELPKFDTKNQEANDLGEQIVKRSDGVNLFYKNEQMISTGASLIGFKANPYVNDNGELQANGTELFNANPLMYIKKAGQLIYLLVEICQLKSKSSYDYIICEEWVKDALSTRNVAILKKEYTDFFETGVVPTKYNIDTIDFEDMQKNSIPPERNNFYRNIPYKLYVNNADCKGDLDDVDEIYFKSLDAYKQMLPIDMLISRTFAFVNANIAKKFKLADKMLTATDNIIETNNSQTQYTGSGVNLSQGLSNAEQIWNSITNTARIIKELSFLRIQASDTGKNNKHTTEIESLNANADDMIEMKANTRELDHIDLLMNWKGFEGDQNRVTLDFTQKDCNVTVTGSTKGLQAQAKIAQANQLGIVNPNDPRNLQPTPTGDEE